MTCRCGNPACPQLGRRFEVREIGKLFGLTLIEDSSLPPDVVQIVSNGETYAFRVDPVENPCSTCKGEGEIIEFPADEDERMVCCPACGGTGEAVQ